MSKLFEGETMVTPRPMNDKQLMSLYEIKHYKTWRKTLKPIEWKLLYRKKEKRILYNTKEVNWIFELLGQPIIFKQINKP